MARIAGVDIPRDKRVEVALTYIYGIGLTRAKTILVKAGVNPDIRVKDLEDGDVQKLRAATEAFTIEGDWEESYSNIWDEYSYWDFYFLALLDSENFQNREHHIIHNLERIRWDNVRYAFNNPFAKMFKNLVDFTAIDKLSVIVLDKTPHEIDIKFLENYILSIISGLLKIGRAHV